MHVSPRSLMGCGISKFNLGEEGKATSPPEQHRLSPVHPRNECAVVDGSLLPKPLALPEGGRRREEHAKVNNSDENGVRVAMESSDSEEEDDGDNNRSYLLSPSFRVYCSRPLIHDENNQG